MSGHGTDNATTLLAGLLGVCLGLAAANGWCDGPAKEIVRLGEGDLLLGVPGEGPLTRAQARAWSADARNHRTLAPVLPLGLAAGAIDLRGLDEKPLTRAKIELGRQLYFDQRLSSDRTVSCATCHAPEHGFAAPTRFGVGVRGKHGKRNSPTAANRLLSAAQFWDGRADSLEDQVLGPISNPIEMGSSHEAVVAFCDKNPPYRVQFDSVFADRVTIENVSKAIAAFERALVSGPSPWDVDRRLQLVSNSLDDGDDDPDLRAERDRLVRSANAKPLSNSARRGAELFFSDRAGCSLCHAGANFTDERYHNLGVGMERAWEGAALSRTDEGAVDWGRFNVTGADDDRGAFKTPSLRNVAQTAPYMHDGSIESLEGVVAWYADGGFDNRHLSPLIQPLSLSREEQSDLVAFLRALTGRWPNIETGRLPE